MTLPFGLRPDEYRPIGRINKEIAALATALKLDFGPAAEAVQAFLNDPTPEAAVALKERLPMLLPEDPQRALMLEQALAEMTVDAQGATVANTEKCPDCGRWMDGNGVCQHCIAAEEVVQSGDNPDSPVVQEAEIGKGKAALKKCLEEKTDVYDAVYRGDLGSISFLYGEKGSTPDEGRGIAHFDHREDTQKKLVETLIRGKLGGIYQQGQKRNIVYGGYEAVLRLQFREPIRDSDGNIVRHPTKAQREEAGKEHPERPMIWVISGFGPKDFPGDRE